MTELLEFTREWGATPGLVASLFSVALKGAAILAAALVAGYVLRRAPASLRHFCWSLAVAAVLFLPLFTLALPSWTLAVLPAPAEKAVVLSVPQQNQAQPWLESKNASAAAKYGDAEAAPVQEAGSAAIFDLSWTQFLLGAWFIGTLGILLYMLTGSIGAARVAARARLIHDPKWLEVLDEIVDRLGIRRPVRLLMSPEIKVPMVWGILRPVVLLPPIAADWDDERRRCVLAHELAHVRRWDGLTQTLAGVTCALHWLNPLVWIAARKLRLERELACDDYVLRTARTRASDYASHLIEIARLAPTSLTPPISAVAMARRSQLEGRVLSILEDRVRRTSPRSSTVLVALFTLLALVPVAAFQPVEHPPSTALVTADKKPDKAGAAANVEAGSVSIHNEVLGVVSTVLTGVNQELEASLKPETLARDVVERSFAVTPGGLLRIESDNGNLEIRTGVENRVLLEVHRTPRGSATAEDFEVTADQNGNEIEIIGETRHFSGGRDGVNVHFVVTIPRQFNVELETGGGNVSVQDLDGRVEAETSGGNLSFGRVTGTVHAETSGGNIRLEDTDGDVEVETSGGEVRIGRVGGRVYAATSGGNILVAGSNGDLVVETSGGNIQLGPVGGTVHAETSGGNIEVEAVTGSIHAETSGGSITARISEQLADDSALVTSGGGVTVYLAADVALNINASSNGGTLDSELPITTDGSVQNDHLLGTLNGGGPLLIIDGSAVRLRRL